jgi:hypothetical protein
MAAHLGGGEVVSGGEKLKNHFMSFAQSKFYLGQKYWAPCPELLAERKFVKNIVLALFCI